jgi:transcription initiation factor TFIID TATA-box-binding protein
VVVLNNNNNNNNKTMEGPPSPTSSPEPNTTTTNNTTITTSPIPKRIKTSSENQPNTMTTTTITTSSALIPPPPPPPSSSNPDDVFIWTVPETGQRISISLQNVVASCNLSGGREINLRLLAIRARNAEYNPEKFSALIFRQTEPKTTALLFNNGKMIVTGSKSERSARDACAKFAAIVKRIQHTDRGVSSIAQEITDFRITNVVGSCDVGFPIQLEHLALQHFRYASYEPEIFPALLYRMAQPKICISIFVNGKIVMTGAKYQEDIFNAFKKIYPVLKEFQKLKYTPLRMPLADSNNNNNNNNNNSTSSGSGMVTSSSSSAAV